MEYQESHGSSSASMHRQGRVLGSGKREREEEPKILQSPSQKSQAASQSTSQAERDEEEEANEPPPELDEVGQAVFVSGSRLTISTM